MSVTHKFRWAENYLKKLHSRDRKGLSSICRSIQQAENSLLKASSELMRDCAENCGGLCCRNLSLDAVFSRNDFIYILSLQSQIRNKIIEVLSLEDPFISQDCIFLSSLVGPCMFPDDIKPMVCITTFCQREGPIKIELKHLKKKFRKLDWFVGLTEIRSLVRRFRKPQ